MKKILLIFIFLLISSLTIEAQIVTGGVEYNQEQARTEAFREPLGFTAYDIVKNHYFDKNNLENLQAIKCGIKKLSDRKVAEFSDGTYGVAYNDDPLYSWYYTYDGRLINFTQKFSKTYPSKTVKYNTRGEVLNVGIKISENESYIFNKTGLMIAHWKGNLCFDANDNIIMVRKSLE